MTAASLNIPDRFHFAIANTDKSVPATNHRVLLTGNQFNLITDFYRVVLRNTENNMVSVYSLHRSCPDCLPGHERWRWTFPMTGRLYACKSGD